MSWLRMRIRRRRAVAAVAAPRTEVVRWGMRPSSGPSSSKGERWPFHRAHWHAARSEGASVLAFARVQ